jgi:hypothetical protein
MPSMVDAGHADSMKELAEFVEISMDEVPIGATNPVLGHALYKEKEMAHDKESVCETEDVAAAESDNSAVCETLEDTPWTDKEGICAFVEKAKAGEHLDEMMNDINDDNGPFSDDWNAFNYD